ncbi:centrosomal protein 295 isoform X2 [Brachyhypopomus gauderio]|uniref:centrosomal protein 295 isoform X2 n=1 Tax=Brachyhypopomus gauderio TaxID=698409 RepID=UPI0040412F13
MKGRTTTGRQLRLSPNEEAQLIREEIERRRKLRVQQVREQERYLALQVRREVKQRKEKELESLAQSLREEWQKQRRKTIQSLEEKLEGSVRAVGQGHRGAKQNGPDWNAVAWRRERHEQEAAERHQHALRNLVSCRRAQEQERTWRYEARQKALTVEKDRAKNVARLPRRAPDPIENVGIQTLPPPKMANLEHYSNTHHHLPEAMVHREINYEQLNAQQAAVLEAQRLEDLENEEARDRKEQLEKAQLRGDHALRKEKVIQDHARLLCELEQLQQADLQRRSRLMNSVPAHIFQPLYRHQELKTEQQEKLEIAFQNLYTSEQDVKGDLVLQLVPEPLPAPYDGGHDEDLDVTLDHEITPLEEEESATPPVGPSVDSGRQPLRRLLERIRNQRDQWSSHQHPVGDVSAAKDNSSIETGSMSNQECEQALSPEQDTPRQLETKSVADSTQQLEVKLTEEERRVQERELLRQQQEQLTLLQELEEKRYNLELQLLEAKKYEPEPQQDSPVHYGKCSLNVPTDPQEVPPGPPPDLNLPSGVEVRGFNHMQGSLPMRRLLDQKRLHEECVRDAWRQLEEYQRTLRVQYAAMMAPTHPVTEETISKCGCQSTAIPTDLTHVLERNTGPPIPLETPQCYQHFLPTESQTSANPAQDLLSKLPQHLEAVSDTQQETDMALVSSSLSNESPRHGSSELKEIPLPPPSVVLELLRNRQHFSEDTRLVPRPLQSRVVRGSVVEMERWGPQTLQTSLREDHVQEESSSLMEESNRHLPPCTPGQAGTSSSFLVASERSVCRSEGGEEVLTPVSHPPRTLHILLQDLVQHKLSTILEVDTPANVSLDKDTEECMQRSSKDLLGHSESSIVTMSPPSVGSGDTKGRTSGSDVMSCNKSTSRASGLSWRETLQLELTGSNAQRNITGADSMDQSRLEEEEFVLPHAEPDLSAEPDHLCSTTISTGSFSTYEPNCSKTDSSPFSSESAGRTEASLTCSDSMFGIRLPKESDPSKFNSGLQCIIDKYTNELDTSLREVQTGLLKVCLSPQSSSNNCQAVEVGRWAPSVSYYFRNDPLQREPIQREFPAMDAGSEVPLNLQLHYGLPHSFSTEHQSASGPAHISKWKNILEPYSEKDIFEESAISLVSLSDTTLEEHYNPPALIEQEYGERETEEKPEEEDARGSTPEDPHHNDMAIQSTRGK